jgi:hypothetical protein
VIVSFSPLFMLPPFFIYGFLLYFHFPRSSKLQFEVEKSLLTGKPIPKAQQQVHPKDLHAIEFLYP